MTGNRYAILLAGLPESGKTTLIAALWHVLRASATPGSEGIALREHPANREYLYEIERQWLDLIEVDHTNFGEPLELTFPLTVRGREIDLEIPDISGENYGRSWEEGAWLESVSTVSAHAHGLLLLVKSDGVVKPLLLEPDDEEEDSDDEDTGEAPTPYDPAQAPTQAKLCDLIESTETARGAAIPTAVVISAWDLAVAAGLTPDQWLEYQLPLLWQMLVADADERPYAVFGLSAQGGDLNSDEQRAELGRLTDAGQRIIVQQGDDRSSDIVAPLAWLIKQDT